MEKDNFPKFSGMQFIADDAFPIEDSEAYKKAKRGNGLRSVEFVRVMGGNLVFIEARSTVAHPDNSPEAYKKEVAEICEKFIHSLNLLSAIRIGIVEEMLPDAFSDGHRLCLFFTVVIRNHEDSWCRPIKRQLENLLPGYIKQIWQPKIFVINYEIAKQMQIAV